MQKGAWFSNLINRELKADSALHGHRLGIEVLSFSSDSHHIVSGSHDQSIKLWDVEREACLQTVNPLSLGVWGLDQNAQGCVVSTGPDGCVALTDFRTPNATAQPPRKLMEKGLFVHAIHGTSSFLVGGNDRLVVVDETMTTNATHASNESAFFSAQSCEGSLLVSNSHGQVLRFDQHLHLEEEEKIGASEIRALTYAENRLFCSAEPGVLGEYTLKPKVAPVKVFLAHSDRINCMDANAASRLLVTGSKDSTTLVWHLDGLRFHCALVGSRDQVTCVRSSSDGRLIALSTWDPCVYLYRTESISAFTT